MSILVSRNYINSNYTLRPGGTPDTHTGRTADILWITTNYYVSVTGLQTSNRCPGSDELSSISSLPIVTGLTISSISNSSFIATANVTYDGGGSGIISRGACWSLNPNPTEVAGYSKEALTQSMGVYTVSCSTNINPGSIYYVRAYARNVNGTSFSTELTVNTFGPPTLSTTTGSAVDYDTINVTGVVVRDNNATITTRGICWSTGTTPTTANSTQSTTGTVGSYTLTINGLSTSTYYYFRAYATNSYGTGYGDQVYITTGGAIPPVVSVLSYVYNASAAQASTDGTIVEWGGATVNQKGLCWSSTNSNPLIGNSSFSNDGTATSNVSWSGTMTSLSPNTTYYYRSYAMNLAYVDVSYSSVYTFTTVPCSSIETDIKLEASSALYCSSTTKVGYIMTADTNSLYTATKLYKGSDCYTYADAGYYGVYGNVNWRYWNGSSFTSSGTCPATTSTSTTSTTSTTTTTAPVGSGYYDCGYGCQYYSYNPGCTTCTPTNHYIVTYYNCAGQCNPIVSGLNIISNIVLITGRYYFDSGLTDFYYISSTGGTGLDGSIVFIDSAYTTCNNALIAYCV